jgi:hypothetical protein
MKRIVLLCGCFLIFTNCGTAQIGFLLAARQSSASGPAGDVRTIAANPEPTTIPAGTHLLMKLTSPLHSTSSTRGSGIYLETVFPVVANDRVLIPEHTRVLGVVENERRSGRVKGRAQMRLQFAQLILPDNRVLSIDGNLQGLPGSSKERKVDNEGTLEPVDQIDADVYTVAKTTGIGVLVGSISHVGIGVPHGALFGAGLGLAAVLFRRGDEISLPVGTRVEMVLQRPLTIRANP